MKHIVSSVLSATLLGGVLAAGAGTAQASEAPPATGGSPWVTQVSPMEERRSMCTVYKDKNACASLITNNKMNNMVKNCLVKAGIGGAGAFVVGKYISKDLAKDIASKVVVAGATACLSSLV